MNLNQIINNKNKQKGFTLIELIVVMAIVGVLVLLAAPRFIGYTKDANVTAMQQDMKVLADAAALYHVDEGEWPIIDGVEPQVIGVGGVGHVYLIDEDKIGALTKNIHNNYNDYGVIINGKDTGKVFHIEGVISKDGYKQHGNNIQENRPIIFDGKKYNDIREVPESPTEWFAFNEINNGAEYEVSGVTIEGVTRISIPAEYRGKPVTKIADGPSTYQSRFHGIEELILPNSIEVIGNSAFYGNNLKNLVLPTSIKGIGRRAFQHNNLTNVHIPNSVSLIDTYAFRNNNINELIIEHGAITFGASPFIDNQLPGHQAFIYERNMDGSENKEVLVSYGGKNRDNVTIPQKVKKIKMYAFYYNRINNITIPDGVNYIGYRAFDYNNLNEVYIPKTVTVLGEAAFQQNGINNNSSSILREDNYHGRWKLEGQTWYQAH